MRHRIVIAPLGLPVTPEAEERCAELLVKCGADLGRMFVGNPQNFRAFENHLAQIRDLREGALSPLVLVCRVQPIERMIETRLSLEARVPALSKAAWVVFADSASEPTSSDALADRGVLDGPILEAPEWIAAERRYLVLSLDLHRHVEIDLAERVRKLTRATTVPIAPVIREIPTAPYESHVKRPDTVPTVPEMRALKSA